MTTSKVLLTQISLGTHENKSRCACRFWIKPTYRVTTQTTSLKGKLWTRVTVNQNHTFH